MHRSDVDRLDSRRHYWVPTVVAPERDWPGAPGCRKGARFLVDRRSFRPTREDFVLFDSQLSCLKWIMRHRAHLNRTLPAAKVRAMPLDRWLLGLE